MHPSFNRALDRWVIRMATRSMPPIGCREPHADEAQALLDDPNLFPEVENVPAVFDLQRSGDFCFASAIETPWANNNVARGKLYRTQADWRGAPTMILLHGWNDELSYRFRLPWFARRLRRQGINVAILELPYHLHRRPQEPGAIKNFISADLWRMVQATQQAISDVRRLALWLRSQGCPRVGVWGSSLGAWLGGLVLCHEPAVTLGVLTTPIADLESVIKNLPFCEAIRSSFSKTNLSLDRLNLASHKPKARLRHVLIQSARDDLFTPASGIETLCERWAHPPLWLVPYGHISILMSPRVVRETIAWISINLSDPWGAGT